MHTYIHWFPLEQEPVGQLIDIYIADHENIKGSVYALPVNKDKKREII